MGFEDCEVNYLWSLCSLVGAFLDLAIAYFLLCASSVVFLGTKFLALFGLHLPCPCNGLFGTPPNRSLCLKRLLVDFPNEKVSNVQVSVKGKFPFNDQKNCHVNLRLIGEEDTNYTHGGVVEIGGEVEEASSSSVVDVRKSCSVPRIEFEPKSEIGVVREERPVPVVKGKGVMNYKSRGWIRRRRKRVDHWTSSSVSSYDPKFVDFQSGPSSPPSVNKERVEISPRNEEDSKEHYGNEVEAHCSNRLRHWQPPIGTAFGQRDSFELNEFPNDDDQTEKNVSSNEELRAHAQMEQRLRTDDKNAIHLLELALEEEQASRAALYLELEKERNAAATAADEAMAMILRLQEEKASIEMEARQYQRIIEEKSAYDEEEMNILKEILVRREREKHFLEKEVETYRQMISLGNGQSGVGDEHILDTERQQLFNSSLDESEDPVLMLHQLSASIDKKVMAKSKTSNEFISINRQNPVLPPGMESSMLEWNEDASYLKQGDLASHPCGNQEFQVKEMVTIINDSYISWAHAERESCKSDVSEHEGEGSKQGENIPDQGMMVVEGLETCGRVDSCIRHDDECLKLHGKDVSQEFHCSSNLSFDKELNVHDVHVIDDGSKVCNEGRRSKVKPSSTNSTINSNLSSEASAAPMIDVTKDTPSTSSCGAQMEGKRSSIDQSNQLPPLGPKPRSVLPCDVRRHSMSTVDIERLKLDYEVERLRERLKTVQEGREKLNLSSVENREGEKFQLKLLEDIANQLREIRQLTEPGKAVRQASLPPPSSKVTTKKKRCRSVSVGIQNRHGS
ncbi:PREDICTED: uncharacterized protein LOC109174953 isoform X2 [Ipomoea nil]|uniref:uncharacterized protein LOC109174953 isoform X2 n=1 Tax=Ipomoea nil TaxID=35883 RepID=UPI000900A785|nr:PREDICTED: uncharacterized protein LOC109174953 isoform X2 [Ipomoea nil]